MQYVIPATIVDNATEFEIDVSRCAEPEIESIITVARPLDSAVHGVSYRE